MTIIADSVGDSHLFDLIKSLRLKVKQLQQKKTIRDEYAMAALTGLLASPHMLGYHDIVSLAFTYADEALKQRGEP